MQCDVMRVHIVLLVTHADNKWSPMRAAPFFSSLQANNSNPVQGLHNCALSRIGWLALIMTSHHLRRWPKC